MWLNESTSYRIFAERDDGAERRIGMLTAVSEDSDHPAIFSIYPADEAWNDSDMSNRTAGSVEPWDNETDIHYPPTASVSADNRSPVAGDSVTFDASDSTVYSDASIASYSWELPDGSTASGSTASWSSSSDDAGTTVTATVTVEDSEGYQDTTQLTLYVAEDAADAAVPPTADATLETDDPMAGESVVLAEAAETADGVALESIEWDVDGDGEFEESGEKLEYQPDQSGLETVTIRVTDANGVSASRSISFFVGSDANSGLGFGGGGGGGGGIGGGPIGGGGGPSGSQQIALGVAGVGAYALWRRSGGPGVVALAGAAAPAVKRAGTSALSAVGTLARGTGRALRKLVGALT
jgi:MYXO-CTERM domain-containing protein